MPRYIYAQKEVASCGVVAIYNAYRWAGVKTPKQKLWKEIAKGVKYVPGEGTGLNEIQNFLAKDKYLDLVAVINKPTWTDLEQYINHPDKLFSSLLYLRDGIPDTSPHLVFAPEIKKEKLRIINSLEPDEWSAKLRVETMLASRTEAIGYTINPVAIIVSPKY